MKEKRSTKRPVRGRKAGSLKLNETVALPGIGITIPVRAAKAKLSALLELVAAGQSVTITSDGAPKAVLSPVGLRHGRKVFSGMGNFLLSQPIHGGPVAEELVREDRDARGW
jgi:prevent-host-death family protein